MSRVALLTLMMAVLSWGPVAAHENDPVKSARAAAPKSLSKNATVKEWGGKVLGQGSNGWVCLPDRPDTPGNDPWCINEPWANFLNAYVSKTKPSYTNLGVAYMLMGDTPVSNTDPYATQKTNDADWVEELGAHLMVVVPDVSILSNYSADPNNGGPWIMWPGTPYEHLMIPISGAPK